MNDYKMGWVVNINIKDKYLGESYNNVTYLSPNLNLGITANEDNLELIKKVRDRSKILVSFGDCAVTGNVTAMRNPLGTPESVLQRCYLEAADIQNQLPNEPGIVPTLLKQVLPVHNVVDVDVYLPGCPPNADRIRVALEMLLTREVSPLTGELIRFG